SLVMMGSGRAEDKGGARRRCRGGRGAVPEAGLPGFGGPAAYLALMEDEVVRRRGWLGRERFLDLVGATNLIPGAELARDGDPHRPCAGRLARPGRGRGVVHPAGVSPRARLRVRSCPRPASSCCYAPRTATSWRSRPNGHPPSDRLCLDAEPAAKGEGAMKKLGVLG